MAQANNVMMIVGRVGADPEMKYIDSNKVVAKFNVAVNRPTKDAEGNYITDWFPCEFWGKQAETASEYVKKGGLISVVGSGRIEKWESNGEKKSRYVVVGDNFQLLSPKNEAGHSAGSTPVASAAPKSKPAPADDFDLEDDVPPF
ncbi:MAG: single-stranded DNA-binding protein [Candidatus Sericytochromatia bacterium]|nr:single-stranded DNA-binding protein [Candidatus Sericytochromatia bacterium]